jgi:hypothetical protein
MPLEKLYYMTEICVGIAFVISILFLAPPPALALLPQG